jgi:hypothetical protein
MDAAHFDRLTSLLATPNARRPLLASLAGGFLAALPLGGTQAKAKKKRKKKRKKKKKSPCVAGTKPCAGACVPRTACCPPCTGGQTCLSNGSCGIACNFEPGDCPDGCSCGPAAMGTGADVCVPDGDSATCAAFTQGCLTSTDCPAGSACILTVCPGEPPDRCFPLCTG